MKWILLVVLMVLVLACRSQESTPTTTPTPIPTVTLAGLMPTEPTRTFTPTPSPALTQSTIPIATLTPIPTTPPTSAPTPEPASLNTSLPEPTPSFPEIPVPLPIVVATPIPKPTLTSLALARETAIQMWAAYLGSRPAALDQGAIVYAAQANTPCRIMPFPIVSCALVGNPGTIWLVSVTHEDLVSVLAHEFGHLINYGDNDPRLCIMQLDCYAARGPFRSIF